MWGKSARFASDAEGGRSGVGIGRQLLESWGFDAAPEVVGRVGIRMEPDAADVDRKGARTGDAGQRLLELTETIFREFADELDGDVQVLGPRPANLRARLECAQQLFQAGDDLVRQVQCGKEAHSP